MYLGQFAFYFPKIFRFYTYHLRLLFDQYPYLRRNFNNSIFPACTFNAGPQCATLEHTDAANYAGSCCPITSGGNFNHKLGRHLILFDWDVAVEFPSGSTIIIPSSSLRHGNAAIQHGKTCISITQYCTGGLICWVQYGFRSVKSCSSQFQELMAAKAGVRWSRALAMFSKVDELHKDHLSIL